MNIQLLKVDFLKYPLGRLIATASVYLPDSGMVLSGFRVYRNRYTTWIHPPARKLSTSDRGVVWMPNFSFQDPVAQAEFDGQVLDLVTAYLNRAGLESEVGDG